MEIKYPEQKTQPPFGTKQFYVLGNHRVSELLIATGGYSRCYLVHRIDGKILCRKKFRDEFEFQQDYQVLSRLNHENIIKFVKSFNDKTDIKEVFYLDLPHYGQSVYDYITGMRESKIPVPLEIISSISQGVLSALQYMHNTMQIGHFDIKPSNIMMTDEAKPILIDFGNARSLGDSYNISYRLGCYEFAPLEALEHGQFTDL